MKLLVIGGGGREHAIIWKLRQSSETHEIYCAPGNGGLEELAICVNIAPTDIQGLLEFAKKNRIDFTIVGMDDPLVMGIVDEFQKEGLNIFGPRKQAALIEGSKAFSKKLMQEYKIPTAGYEVFDSFEKAFSYCKGSSYPLVIKADGLALGKGVVICQNPQEAEEALSEMMVSKKFGASGDKVVIEEYLTGPEVSVLAFCDGKTLIPMVSAQDHKRALDGDKGLNTGGMGAFSPSRHYTAETERICRETIFEPTRRALQEKGGYQGVLFFGLMLTKTGPKVIEYNCRFGDPETQVVLPRLKGDLLEILLACSTGTLHELDIQWEENAAACVVMASGGYPAHYAKGYPITGLEEASQKENIVVFHAGTKKETGKIQTNGGRVLGVTGIGSNLEEAIEKVYEAVEGIQFQNVHYRSDIGRTK